MKEQYMTPDFYFEDFRLSYSIAAGCNTYLTSIKMDAGFFLAEANLQCNNQWSDVSSEDLCYSQGSGAKALLS